MLYLSRSTGLLVDSFLAYHPGSLLKSLRESKAVDNMNSVAIPVKQPLFYKFIETFRLYPSLELVFVVLGQELFMKDKDWVTNGRNVAYWRQRLCRGWEAGVRHIFGQNRVWRFGCKNLWLGVK